MNNPLVGLGLVAIGTLIAFAIMDVIKHKNNKKEKK
jgi:hypothetical protein